MTLQFYLVEWIKLQHKQVTELKLIVKNLSNSLTEKHSEGFETVYVG